MPDRAVVRFRILDDKLDDGEIPLDDLARIAHETQIFVRRIARSLAGQRRPGRATSSVEQASALRLVGLHRGSTILEIAGVESASDVLDYDLPMDLSDLSMALLVDGFAAIADQRDAPAMPVGYDQTMIQDLDEWLKSVQTYTSISMEWTVDGKQTTATASPRQARNRLKTVESQPSLPYVSRTDQSLEGVLYALNTHTGTYSIEDDAGHKIRLKVPGDLRADAAQLITRRVRAIGRPELDSGRLTAFTVAQLVQAPDMAVLEGQGRFYERHELVIAERADDENVTDRWIVAELTVDESNDFLAALADLR